MKIAIHHRPGSFSDQWITYCKNENIDYKIVNAFDSDIIAQVMECDAFLWHHHHDQFKDALTAKRILFALDHAGIPVYPNIPTTWHFDDKVAQKYLLEAIKAPLVPSYVFYDKAGALKWANLAHYPIVFKLKGGAGAKNVKLINTKAEARSLIKKAFGKGFSQFDKWGNFKDRYHQFKNGNDSILGVVKSIVRLFIPTDYAKQQSREKGYVYFQEFIPNNGHDTRVVVIGGKVAAAEKRIVRKGDFRASGSGEYNYEHIDTNCIRIALDIAKKLNLQSVAFDFVEDENKNPLIVEISYGFGTKGIQKAPGYWDENLIWHEDSFKPQEWIIENVIKVEK